MMLLMLRILIPAIIILVVSELSRRSPRLGALLLTLPLVSILAFADRLGLGFWRAMLAGLILATMTIGAWLAFGPK